MKGKQMKNRIICFMTGLVMGVLSMLALNSLHKPLVLGYAEVVSPYIVRGLE